jgi:hypothetical protein
MAPVERARELLARITSAKSGEFCDAQCLAGVHRKADGRTLRDPRAGSERGHRGRIRITGKGRPKACRQRVGDLSPGDREVSQKPEYRLKGGFRPQISDCGQNSAPRSSAAASSAMTTGPCPAVLRRGGHAAASARSGAGGRGRWATVSRPAARPRSGSHARPHRHLRAPL